MILKKLVFTATFCSLLCAPLKNALAATPSQDDAPPPAEAPYPNAPEEGFAQKPAPRINEPGMENTSAPGAITDAIVDDPVSSDVSNEPLTPPKRNARVSAASNQDSNAPKPLKKNKDGSYEYSKDPDKGEYRYKTVKSKEMNYNEHDPLPVSSHSTFVRFAYFDAPQITNPANGKTFQDIYHAQHIPAALIDYEWKISRSIGDVGLKVASGIFFSQGRGQWVNPNTYHDQYPPLERFTFLMFPTTASGIYRFKYRDAQLFVPYVEGGGGVFTFVETRDDSKGPKFGASPVAMVDGGLNILIDGVDRNAMKNLRNEYSINHLYLNIEYRQYVGFGKYNFSSSVYVGGLGADF